MIKSRPLISYIEVQVEIAVPTSKGCPATLTQKIQALLKAPLKQRH
jgi:hypothetical protein